MKVLAALLLALVAPATALAEQAPAAAAPLPSVELPAELARVLRDYEKAWQARDAAALAGLFAEDGFVLASGRPGVRGRAAIREAYSGAGGPLALRAFEYATSGDVGYIVGGYAGSPGAPDDGKFVLALVRDGSGRWLIRADIDNANQRRQPVPATP
jgi:ketosteroid isomerase-like protein